MNQPYHTANKKTGLVLSGGGARAAYQVGVLKAIARILPRSVHNPFQVISGTSAGAINAAAMATYANNYRLGVKQIEYVWKNFTSDQIYRTDFLGLSASVGSLAWSVLSSDRKKRVSLLNNQPLRQLLKRVILFDNIQHCIDEGNLHAFAVNTSGYTSGESVAFYQGHYSIQNWQRQRRIGIRTNINIDHLMASSAIPAVFPAVKINREYFGDGAVRQLAPISPSIHLGSEKILVIGLSGSAHQRVDRKRYTDQYPGLSGMMAHMLNASFLDSMESDVERVQRINRTLGLIPDDIRAAHAMELRPIELLEISPSKSIDDVAGEHVKEIPRLVRTILRKTGRNATNGSGIISYILFEQGFCQALLDLGYNDAMARKDEIKRFFAEYYPSTEGETS